MNENKKSLKGIMRILILFAAIIVLFWWYTSQNNDRIKKQNLRYAADSAQQKAKNIEDEFENACNRISTYSYFLGQSLSEPTVQAQALSEMTQNSLFDSFAFTNASGVSLFSDGHSSDSSNTEHFINGMNGETGISVEFQSDQFG